MDMHHHDMRGRISSGRALIPCGGRLQNVFGFIDMEIQNTILLLLWLNGTIDSELSRIRSQTIESNNLIKISRY